MNKETFSFNHLYPVQDKGAVNYIRTGIRGIPTSTTGYVCFGDKDSGYSSFTIPQCLHRAGFDQTAEAYNIVTMQDPDGYMVIMITTNDDRLLTIPHFGEVTLEYIPANE